MSCVDTLRKALTWALLFWLMAMLATAVHGAHAQSETNTISGSLVNGTAGAGTSTDMQVTLSVLYQDGEADQRTTNVDDQGRFTFQDVPPSTVSNISGYAITATYLGVDYIVQLAPGQDTNDVTVTVYEVTSSMDNLSIKGNTLLVLNAKPVTRTLTFLEIVQISNDGDRTFVPQTADDGSMSFLRFPLPANATNLDVQAELPEGQVLQVDKGFALVAPVPPGAHNIAFGYTANYSSTTLDISRSFLNGADTFRVLVSNDVGDVSSPDMIDNGNTAIGSTTFHLLEANDLPPDADLSILLQGLPQPTLLQRIQGISSRISWAVAIAAVLVIVMAVLLAIGIRKRPLAERVTSNMSNMDRESLIHAIALLDDQFQEGKLAEADYHEQREVLMERLLQLDMQSKAVP